MGQLEMLVWASLQDGSFKTGLSRGGRELPEQARAPRQKPHHLLWRSSLGGHSRCALLVEGVTSSLRFKKGPWMATFEGRRVKEFASMSQHCHSLSLDKRHSRSSPRQNRLISSPNIPRQPRSIMASDSCSQSRVSSLIKSGRGKGCSGWVPCESSSCLEDLRRETSCPHAPPHSTCHGGQGSPRTPHSNRKRVGGPPQSQGWRGTRPSVLTHPRLVRHSHSLSAGLRALADPAGVLVVHKSPPVPAAERPWLAAFLRTVRSPETSLHFAPLCSL